MPRTSEPNNKTYSGSSDQPKHTSSSLFGSPSNKSTSHRYIPELNSMTQQSPASKQAREQELNDEGFEETQSLVSETLSQEASSGNYETDTHDSTRCSPAELTRTTAVANSNNSGTAGLLGKSSSPIVGNGGGTSSKTLQQRRDGLGRISAAQDKSLTRIKGFERRDSRDSLSGRSVKSQEGSSFLPKRTGSLKREPPAR